MKKNELKAITKKLFIVNKKRLILLLIFVLIAVGIAMGIIFIPFFNYKENIKSLFDKFKQTDWSNPSSVFALFLSVVGYAITMLSIPLKIFEMILMFRLRLMLAVMIKKGILNPDEFLNEIKHSWLSIRKQRKLEQELLEIERTKSSY